MKPFARAVRAKDTGAIVAIILRPPELTDRDWREPSRVADSNSLTFRESLFDADYVGKPVAGYRKIIQHKEQVLLGQWPAVLAAEV